MDTLTLGLRVVLSLAFVALVLWYVQKRVSRTQRGTRVGDSLTIISRRGLGKSSALVVVETDGKRLLLGVTEQTVSVLHTAEVPEPPHEAVSAAPDFALSLTEVSGTDKQILLSRRHQRRPSPQTGSMLSVRNWRHAGAAIRKGVIG